MISQLLSNKDARYCCVIVVLGLAVIFSGMRIKDLDAQLSEKPNIETKIETHIVTKDVKGPEKIVEHEVLVPGTTTVMYVDRVITREGDTITKTQDRDVEKILTQAHDNPNRWIAGIGVNPANAGGFPTLRGGYSWGNRLDLTGSVDVMNKQGRIEASLRFR